MLAANTCAADFMERSKHPGLYRIHEGPTPEKLQALRDFLKTLGLSLGGGDKPAAADYSALLASAKNRPDAPLLQTMALRSMQQAMYSPDNVGHFGLAYPAYAHFTSPIRRYPDLLTHRVIKALLHGKRYVPNALEDMPVMPGTAKEQEHALWEKLGLFCSANERRADDASRDVEAWLKCWYMRERVGDVFSGTVTGVAPFGVFVTLDELHVEGLVHVSELGAEYFQFNDGLHELRGERTGMRYRLTDKMQVQVARVDLEARRIEFKLVKGVTYEGLRKAIKRDSAPAPERKPAKPKAVLLTDMSKMPKGKKAAAKKHAAPEKPASARSGKRAAAKHGRGKRH
jgi:ribonuclease R